MIDSILSLLMLSVIKMLIQLSSYFLVLMHSKPLLYKGIDGSLSMAHFLSFSNLVPYDFKLSATRLGDTKAKLKGQADYLSCKSSC
jgi:hypothetical protein